MVFGLRIVDNLIQRCVRGQIDRRPDGLPHGGIVLSDSRHVTIHRNRIESNGGKANVGVPVCGIFALRTWGIEVADNQVHANGRPPETLGERRDQGGIVILEAEPPTSYGHAQQALGGIVDLHAARVAGNTVVAPGTLALHLTGRGPMQVTDNRFTTHGVIGLGIEFVPTIVELLGALDSIAALLAASAISPSSYVGAVFILNLGMPLIFQEVSQGKGYTALDVDTSWSTSRVGRAELSGPGGAVQFSDNQVMLSMQTEPPTLLLMGTGIATLDDLVMTANQTTNDLNQSVELFDVLALAATARVVANGFAESLTQCLYSLISQAWLASTGTNNQGTHCIAILGNPARTVDQGNIALACMFGGRAAFVGGQRNTVTL